MRRVARVLVVLGIVACVGGLSKIHAAVVGHYDYTASSRLTWSIVYMAVLYLSAYGVGIPDLARSRTTSLATGLAGAVGGAVVFSVAQLVLGEPVLPRFVILGSAAILVPYFALCGRLASDERGEEVGSDRIVVVGDWAEAAQLTMELELSAERPARVVDVLTLPDALGGASGEERIVDTVEQLEADVVVLDRSAQVEYAVVDQVAKLHASGVRIRTMSLFYEEWLGKLPVSDLERVSLMFDIGEVHRWRYGRFKRVADVVVALGTLPLFVAVLPIVLIGNLIGNRGPLFFAQERVGRGGVPFKMFKFRTMVPQADSAGSWTERDDPRITRFGAVLRRSHIDELPQLFNILGGSLSVVGPRPEQPHYVEELSVKLPYYQLRHLVRPGLTGWAQVKYGYAADAQDAREKLQYEFYYLRRQSLLFDLRIVIRTIRSVLRSQGR